MKAYFVKEVQRSGIPWDRHLYQVEPPFQYRDWNDRTTMRLLFTDYLLVSATIGEREKETIILPADENGTPLDTTPLSGSLKNDRTHEAALRKMGYKICTEDDEVIEPPKSEIPTQIEDYNGDFIDLAQWEETTILLTTDDDTTLIVHGVTHPKFGIMVWDKTRTKDKEAFIKAMLRRKAEMVEPTNLEELGILFTAEAVKQMEAMEVRPFPPVRASSAISTDGEDPITPDEEEEEEEEFPIYDSNKTHKVVRGPK